MQDSYGMKASFTCVVNGNDYQMGYTYQDTNGTNVDKQLQGDMNSIADDMAKEIVETYFKAYSKAQQQKHAKAGNEHEERVVEAQRDTADYIKNLEEENRKLNRKIAEMESKKDTSIPVRTSTPVPEEKQDDGFLKRMNDTKTFKIKADVAHKPIKDIERLLKILGY